MVKKHDPFGPAGLDRTCLAGSVRSHGDGRGRIGTETEPNAPIA